MLHRHRTLCRRGSVRRPAVHLAMMNCRAVGSVHTSPCPHSASRRPIPRSRVDRTARARYRQCRCAARPICSLPMQYCSAPVRSNADPPSARCQLLYRHRHCMFDADRGWIDRPIASACSCARIDRARSARRCRSVHRSWCDTRSTRTLPQAFSGVVTPRGECRTLQRGGRGFGPDAMRRRFVHRRLLANTAGSQC